MNPSTSSTAGWARTSGAARRARSTGANTAPASTASAARASSPTTACSSRPSRSCAAITATFPSGSSAASMTKRIRMKGDTGAHMIGLLERRLDAIVYRAKFVPTVFAARQFINHGHIKVNGKRVNIPSYRVKVGDVVEVKEKSKQMQLVLEAQALGRARRARLHRGRRRQDDRQARAHPGDHRRALSGADGAAPGGRILFALTAIGVSRHDSRLEVEASCSHRQGLCNCGCRLRLRR